MPFTPWHRSAVWDATRVPDHPRGPSLRTSRSGFRLPGDPMSKAGAKARHSGRNWRFLAGAHQTRATNAEGPARANLTDLLGKLPRNVSDHENLPCFQGEIACTRLRSVTRRRCDLSASGHRSDRRQNAQIPDMAGRETVSPRLVRRGPVCQPGLSPVTRHRGGLPPCGFGAGRRRGSDRRELSVSDRTLRAGGRRPKRVAVRRQSGRPGLASGPDSATRKPTQPSRSSRA